MQIDQYGFEATSVHYQRRQLQPYRVAENGDVTYICFTDAANRSIHRITKSATETIIEWAYGAWADRESLTYIPINTPREI